MKSGIFVVINKTPFLIFGSKITHFRALIILVCMSIFGLWHFIDHSDDLLDD